MVFCEEKISLMAERLLCSKAGGSFNTDVYSFGNFLRVKKPNVTALTKEGSAMAIKKILSTLRLSCFKASRVMLAPTLTELIMQLKSAKVTPSDIFSAIEKSDGVLKNKLTDIYSVYSEYEQFILKNGLDDQSSSLSYLPEIILNSEEIERADVFIVGFTGFTAQIRSCISALVDKANSVTAILLKGDNPLVYVNETAEYIKELCLNKGVPLLEKKVLSDYNSEGQIITDNLFNGNFNNFKLKTSGGRVFKRDALNVTDEVERVGQVIKQKVIKGECRYRDFTIALSDVNAYKSYIKNVFDQLEIPYFLDERKKPDNHPLITLICAYIDVFRKNFERKALTAFFKNPLFESDKTLSDNFENYIIKYNVNYGRINQPFSLRQNEENIEELELFRQRICSSLKKFNVRDMLNLLCVKEKIENYTGILSELNQAEESAINSQIYDAVIKILDQMDNLLAGVNMTESEFKSVFMSGVGALELSIIPQYNDAVFIGEYKECSLAKAKNLFVLGLTSQVPFVHADIALLSDSDINSLEKIKVMVEPKIKVVNHRTRESIALCLSAFSESLYLSYPVCAIDGSKNSKSQILDEMDKMFNLQPFPKSEDYLTYKQGEKNFARECGEFALGSNNDFSNASAFFNAVNQDKLRYLLDCANKEMQVKLDCENPDLIGQVISPTTVENYYKCPYRTFLAHKLRLKIREEGRVEAFSVGNLMHDIFSRYVLKLDKVSDQISSDALVSEIVKEILSRDEYRRFMADGETKASILRVVRESKSYCYKTFISLNNSTFKVDKTEADFGDGERCQFPAVKLIDCNVKIAGKIDRVDVSDQFFRVLDYKTGSADAGEKSLFSGEKLQLYLYGASVKEKFDGQKKIAGLYYLPVSDKYKNKGEKEKALAVGKTLDEQDALLAQDRGILDGNHGKFLPLNTHGGSVKDSMSSDDLSAYLEYAVAISSLATKQMQEGVIVASPVEGACEYCQYRALCERYDGIERKVEKVNSKTIIDAVKGESENAKIDR